MKLELEVLASASIKRKKPWPRLAFLGEAQASIFLLDAQRLSVLFLPSGKTRRKIPKLQPILPDIVSMTTTDNGQFLVGLLRSGDLFLWHKDTDLLKFVPGLADLAEGTETHSRTDRHKHKQDKGPPVSPPAFHLHAADDGTKLVVVSMATALVYVWELDSNVGLFDPGPNTLSGAWCRVGPPGGSTDPVAPVCVTAGFCVREPGPGLVCVVSFVANRAGCLCVTSAVLSWFDVQNVFAFRYPTFTAQWHTINHPLANISSDAQAINCPGAYLASQSHDGNLVAVAMNQLSTSSNRLAFVSVWSDTVVVVDMKGMGLRSPVKRNAHQYWVVDVTWTCDDLFVACVTGQGALCLLTRLGEPILIQTYGCNVNMGPKHYLPLHPLISVSVESEDEGIQPDSAAALTAVTAAHADPLRQRYSVTAHPAASVLLVSDGFLVTALQLPDALSCLAVTRALVADSTLHLHRVRDQQQTHTALFDSLKRQGAVGPKVDKTGRVTHHRLGLAPSTESTNPASGSKPATRPSTRYKFEPEDPNTDHDLDETADSEIADFILAGDLNIGKITFGDVENLNTTVEFDRFTQSEGLSVAEHLLGALRDLTAAWGLAASHVGLWTAEHDDACHNIVHNTVRLYAMILHSDAKVLKELDLLQGHRPTKRDRRKAFVKVLTLFQNFIGLLRLDSHQQHLMSCGFTLTNYMTELFLHNKDLTKKQSRLQTLHATYLLLRYCDSVLSAAYMPLPVPEPYSGLTGPAYTSPPPLDLYTPPSLARLTPTAQLPRPLPRPRQDKAVEVPTETDEGYMSQPSARSVTGSEVKVTDVGVSEETYTGQALRPQSRLLPLWRLLHKYTAKHHVALSRSADTEAKGSAGHDASLALRLLQLIQATIHSLGGQVAPRRKTRVLPGDRLYIEGSTALAINSWNQLLEKVPDDALTGRLGGRLLHAIFYALMLDGRLRSAMTLTDLVLLHPDLRSAVTAHRQNEATRAALLDLLHQKSEVESPAVLLSCKSSRQLVQSLARLMAAYFSNREMYVYPPHAPHRVTSTLKQDRKARRVVPLYPDTLSAAVRHQKLGAAWTPDRTLEYLLVSGLYPEALGFVRDLADWKAAFLMSVAWERHRDLAPGLHQRVRLPRELSPAAILKGHLESAFLSDSQGVPLLMDANSDQSALTRTLRDLLLVSAVCRVDVLPWLLRGLVSRLVDLARCFSPLVPDDFYLPAPPVYCPQPPPTTRTEDTDAARESLLRRETSSVLVLLLTVLSASWSADPAAEWYAQNVLDAITRAVKLRGKSSREDLVLDVSVLQESYLMTESVFTDRKESPGVRAVLTAFREVCSVMWMLYARDKLSEELRKKTKLAQQRIQSPTTVSQEDWHTSIRAALSWNIHMLTFSSFLDGDSILRENLLSLILELPHSATAARLLAEHFPDVSQEEPEIQDKLQRILKEWQGQFLRSDSTDKDSSGHTPRGITMSVCYHSNLHRAEKNRKRRLKAFGEYEDQVLFSQYTNEESNQRDEVAKVGSRFFESTQEFLEFLDVFYAITFKRESDKQQGDGPPAPLLLEFSDQIQQQEFFSSPAKSSRKHRGRSKISVQIPDNNASPDVSSPAVKQGSVIPDLAGIKGLFRSSSLTEIRSSSVSGKAFSRSSSQENLVESPGEKNHPTKGVKSLLERSFSISDLNDLESKKSSVPDPLSHSSLPPWILDNMKVDKFSSLEPLLDWISRWSDRNHTLVPDNRSPETKAAIRVHVPPRLVLYSLWLLENVYDPDPSVRRAEVSREQREIVVNVAHRHKLPTGSSKKKKQNKEKKAEEEKLKAAEATPSSSQPRQRTEPRKLSFRLPDQPPEDHISVGNASAASSETLSVSSLHEEDLRQMEETIAKLESSMHIEDLETSGQPVAASTLESMNSTLRFPRVEPTETPHEDEPDFTPLSHSTTVPNSRSPQQKPKRSRSTQQKPNQKPAQKTQSQSESRGVQVLEDTGSTVGTTTQARSTLGNSTQPASEGNNSIAQELQGMVRQELRKIMEAQHKGILAMLGALDDTNSQTTDSMNLTNLTNSHLQNGHSLQSNGRISKPKKKGKKNVDCVVMSVQAPLKSSTDVTPMLSDASEKALSLSDVEKDIVPQQAASVQAAGRHQAPTSGLGDALRQLKLLEGQHHFHQNKENVRPPPPSDAQQFGRLMSLLRDTNTADHGQISWPLPGQPRLLRLAPETKPGVHLPHIPRPAWEAPATRPPPAAPRYRLEDIAERERPFSNQPPGAAPFPLLRLKQPEERKPPKLVPPEEILVHEHLKYQKKPLNKRQVREYVNNLMANQLAAQRVPSEPVGKKLLLPDTFEPFVLADERDKKQRERRRKQRDKESAAKVSPRMGKKAKVKVDSSQHSSENTLTPDTTADSIVDEVVDASAAASPRKTSPRRVTVVSPRKHPSPPGDDEDDDIDNKKISHGFALTPGLFDEYLDAQDELGSAADTNARLQYRAATSTKPKPKMSTRDTATEMSPRKDRSRDGDPVSEAVQEYYRAKTGHTATILPPDVFLGLGYDDVNKPADQPGQSRAFLNVVDINADLMEEIKSPRQTRDASKPADSDRRKVTLPSERVRQQAVDRALEVLESDDLRAPGPDPLTAGLFGRPVSTVDRVSAEDAIYTSTKVKSRDSIKRRLEDMNSQFSAIEALSNNIEQDFKSSELILHTIDQMGSALAPTEDRRDAQQSTSADAGLTRDHHAVFDGYNGPKPSAVREYRRQDRSPRREHGKKEVVFEDDGLSPEQRVRDIRDQLGVSVDQEAAEEQPDERAAETDDSQRLDLSGLTGVSDIVGEMLAKGEVRAEDMGLSRRQADTLADKALRSSRDGVRLSKEDLEQIFHSTTSPRESSPQASQKRTEEQQRQLQAWIRSKRAERQQGYQEQRTKLREAERQPYQPLDTTNTSLGQTRTLETRTQDKRREEQEEALRRREELASELMGDLLSDHPDLPPELPQRTTTSPQRTRPRTTGARRDTSRSPSRGQTARGTEGKTVVRKVATARPESSRHVGRTASRSPVRKDPDRTQVSADQYLEGRVDSKTRVIRPRQFAERVDPADLENVPPTDRQASSRPAQRSARQKSLSEMVRLQRPEVTRQKRKVKPLTYTDRLSQLQGEGSTTRSEGTTLRDQQRLYGSQRLPGSSPVRSAPRQVKTYTQRLQDMKRPVSQPQRGGRRPVSAPESRPSSAPAIRRGGITPRKPGRQKTYAEQLQELQPAPRESHRGHETITLYQGPSRKASHKPPHKPKTYQDQLRELQAPASVRHSDTYATTPPKVYRTAPLASKVRPYTSPYDDYDADDRLSVVSPWSVDSDIQRLLDDGQSQGRRSAPPPDLSLSDVSEPLAYVGDDDYVSQVDVRDLADVGSLSEGSIMSFIDWDQVDQLIGDVH